LEYAAVGALQSMVAVGDAPSASLRVQAMNNPTLSGRGIRFAISGKAGQPVMLSVFDVRGRQIVSVGGKLNEIGSCGLDWDGADVRGARAASGVYFGQVRSGSETVLARVVLLK
jgi:hypothetical protein